MIADSIVAVARRFLFVREEGGPNRGLWVELFLRFTGNAPGDSWCCSFVCYVLNIVYRGKSPLIKTGGCDELLADCRKRGYIVWGPPRPGDLLFSMNGEDAHHVAICTDEIRANGISMTVDTIAGNTSEDGKSSNGTGVFEHAVAMKDKCIARLPNAA